MKKKEFNNKIMFLTYKLLIKINQLFNYNIIIATILKINDTMTLYDDVNEKLHNIPE